VIDLHTHILPGLDDGPRDLPATLMMAEVAVENGITTIVGTPHIREDYPRVRPAELPGLAETLEGALADAGVPLRVLAGGELAITRAVDMSDDELRAVTLAQNGRDLLVETPHGPLPSIFDVVIADLQSRGFRVTLAHPELNADMRRGLDRLRSMVDAGALVQITAESLGARWARRGQWSRKALKAGLVHVVASDSHSAAWRPPDLGPARDLGALGEWLTRSAPAALLAGDELPPRPR
jgi:protein-tyrosine phosphatase